MARRFIPLVVGITLTVGLIGTARNIVPIVGPQFEAVLARESLNYPQNVIGVFEVDSERVATVLNEETPAVAVVMAHGQSGGAPALHRIEGMQGSVATEFNVSGGPANETLVGLDYFEGAPAIAVFNPDNVSNPVQIVSLTATNPCDDWSTHFTVSGIWLRNLAGGGFQGVVRYGPPNDSFAHHLRFSGAALLTDSNITFHCNSGSASRSSPLLSDSSSTDPSSGLGEPDPLPDPKPFQRMIAIDAGGSPAAADSPFGYLGTEGPLFVVTVMTSSGVQRHTLELPGEMGILLDARNHPLDATLGVALVHVADGYGFVNEFGVVTYRLPLAAGVNPIIAYQPVYSLLPFQHDNGVDRRYHGAVLTSTGGALTMSTLFSPVLEAGDLTTETMPLVMNNNTLVASAPVIMTPRGRVTIEEQEAILLDYHPLARLSADVLAYSALRREGIEPLRLGRVYLQAQQTLQPPRLSRPSDCGTKIVSSGDQIIDWNPSFVRTSLSRPSMTYTITHQGSLSYSGISVVVPRGFSVVTPPASTLSAGASTSFTVRFTGPTPLTTGKFGGPVVVRYNNGEEFRFGVQGEVTSNIFATLNMARDCAAQSPPTSAF